MTLTKMTTLARPYATAAFEFAAEKNVVPAWSAMLDAAGLVTADPAASQWLANPNVTKDESAALYEAVLQPYLNADMKNFIRLLAEYDRLPVLPDIAVLFRAYRAEQEKELAVQVTSAVPMGDACRQKLIETLTKRLRRRITLNPVVDPALLGGAIVTAGDTVIDGSIRGKLDRMAKFISESF